MNGCSQHYQALIMAVAAFLQWSLTLLVKVLMGIAVLDGQWVSWDISGLLGMWDRHRGTNRGADGCVEAVISVLENQGGKAAGVTTTRIISAHTSVQACACRASLLSSPLQTDCVQRQGLWHSSMLGWSQDSPVFIGTGTWAAYGCLLLKCTEGRAAGDFNGVCNVILDVMGSFCIISMLTQKLCRILILIPS